MRVRLKGLAWLTLALVGCHSSSSADSAEPATFVACQTDNDCPQPPRACESCSDGTTVCTKSQCGTAYGTIFEDGGWQPVSCQGTSCGPRQCVDSPAWCSNAKTDPCAKKTCGDSCQQCNTADGSCYAGRCNARGACKTDVPDCTGNGKQMLAEACMKNSDAVGVGDCNYLFGWSWSTSAGCAPVVGCSCVGSDCNDLFSFFCSELAGCVPQGADASCAAQIPNTCFDAGAGRD